MQGLQSAAAISAVIALLLAASPPCFFGTSDPTLRPANPMMCDPRASTERRRPLRLRRQHDV